MEPVGMFGVQRAIGGHPVDHEIGQQGQAVLTCGVRERADCVSGRLLSLEHWMQPGVVADYLSVAGLPRLEEAADQRVIEAQRGRVSEPRRPRVERTNQK